MKENFKKVLILAPHTDDGEMACGATISKLIEEGMQVYYAAFSACEESVPAGFERDCLKKELREATTVLGINQEKVYIFDCKVRHFSEERQKILDLMISLNKKINPDIVFTPSIHDIHQDHLVIANESLRAFKHTTILSYEVPWNNYRFNNQAFICVSEKNVEYKIRALKKYISQKNRNYADEDFIKGILRTHGVQAGVKFAEVFEIPRMIIKEMR